MEVSDFDRRAAAFPSQGDAGMARHRIYLVGELPSRRDKAAYLWGWRSPARSCWRAKVTVESIASAVGSPGCCGPIRRARDAGTRPRG